MDFFPDLKKYLYFFFRDVLTIEGIVVFRGDVNQWTFQQIPYCMSDVNS
jgi:hypothetical protein